MHALGFDALRFDRGVAQAHRPARRGDEFARQLVQADFELVVLPRRRRLRRVGVGTAGVRGLVALEIAEVGDAEVGQRAALGQLVEIVVELVDDHRRARIGQAVAQLGDGVDDAHGAAPAQ